MKVTLAPSDSAGAFPDAIAFPPPLDEERMPVDPAFYAQISTILLEYAPLGLLLFEVGNWVALEKTFGHKLAADIMEISEDLLQHLSGQLLGETRFKTIRRLNQSAVGVLFHFPGLIVDHLDSFSLSFCIALRTLLNTEMVKRTGQKIDLLTAYTLLEPNSGETAERTLTRAMHGVRKVRNSQHSHQQLSMRDEFHHLIRTSALGVVYQPIVNFITGSIIGWEALARLPQCSSFPSIAFLFEFAEEINQLFTLERLCRNNAIQRLGSLEHNQFLFLNLHPRVLLDPKFSVQSLTQQVKECQLKPQNIVLEIVERQDVKDFAMFHAVLSEFRENGFLVAVDDVGAGYAGLWSVAEIKPDFIKVDMSLTRGVDSNPVKRALFESLVILADRIGSKIIGEGIETETELTCLMSLQVHCGQGYFVARPQFPKPTDTLIVPKRSQNGRSIGKWKCSLPIRELAQPCPWIHPSVQIRQAKEMLENKHSMEVESPISGLVVVNKKVPVGLVMEHHLNRQLGSRFGVALYYNREIHHLMDSQPLIVDGDQPVELVAQRVASRDRMKIYDHIIVVEAGEYFGVVSVQKMLDTLASVQVEMAKGASPLTGLPGNLAIEKEYLRRYDARQAISLIYVDLDWFKVYNDSYGFKKGDQVLLLLSNILQWACKRHGTEDDFVGHIGGDDFVLITQPDCSERICKGIIRCFKRLSKQAYNQEDRNREYIIGTDREGKTREIPLLSISLAILDSYDSCDLLEVARRAAELKHYAKTLSGNVYVRDRRSPISQG